MICDDCVYAGRPSYAYPCSKCDMKEWSPLCMYERKVIHTNADHIRSMSDNELVTLVRALLKAEDCHAGEDADCEKCFFGKICYNCLNYTGRELEWLQQPTEVE